MLGRRVVALVAALTSLAAAPCALAVTPTQITCPQLPSMMNSAVAGEVLQLPPGPCMTQVSVTANTNAFTLEGATSGGATELEPTNTTLPIIDASADVKFTLTGLTFTGETSASALLLTGSGEAATVTGDTFTNNAAGGAGSAIAVQISGQGATTQPTTISDNTFSHDSAVSGGAVAFENSALPLVVSGNTFTANSSMNGGGALFVTQPPGSTAAVTVTGNRFGGPNPGDGNTTEGQGGAAWFQMAHGASLAITGNTFQDNGIVGTQTATAGDERWGGAVFLLQDPLDSAFTVAQSHNLFAGNTISETEAPATTALPTGGGAEWVVGGTVNSLDDTFQSNRVAVADGKPPEGGAVGALASNSASSPTNPGIFNGTNDLFRGNSVVAGGWGGAIYVGGVPLFCTDVCIPSTATLRDSTVVGNTVGSGSGSEGGAIWGSPGDHLTLENSIVYGNTPKPELFGFGSGSPTITFSDACGESGGTAVPAKRGNICANPELTAAGIETVSSPTLDAGSNPLVPGGVTKDLAGNSRIRANRRGCSSHQPAVVDIGAFEYTGLTPPPPCPAPPPFVTIGNIHLEHHKHKHLLAARVECRKGVGFCAGTISVSSAGKHKRRLAKHSFRLKAGHSSRFELRLAHPHFPRTGEVKLTITVQAHDKAGASVGIGEAGSFRV